MRTVVTLQPATTLCLLQERMLIYGLGDEGYGTIFLKEDFRMFESNSGQEKYKRSVAKTTMFPTFHNDGFVWKVGGYTAITGGYTKKSQGRKKTASFISGLKEQKAGTGSYRPTKQLAKQANILGEVSENTFLMYSFTDHSFATWNSMSGEFKRVNLISKGSNFGRSGDVDPSAKYEHTGGPLAKDCVLGGGRSAQFKSITLHPGCYDNSFPYLIAVSRTDKVTIRKFQIVDGYSCPISLDEEKPGIRGFDCSWSKDGTVTTY